MGSVESPQKHVSANEASAHKPQRRNGLKIHTMKLDAGLRSLDHCRTLPFDKLLSSCTDYEIDKNKLPRWRYVPRQRLIPLIRWETPYLAAMQSRMRSPALDSYFSITANLGTHTFFMIVLPILFWCGFTSLGRG